MNAPFPKMQAERRPIRQLDEAASNRIAAGEVVERPASAVKELVENALDAGASRVEIAFADGGRSLIRVSDDGHGIPEGELTLALSRHATSKIDGSDLVNITSYGFRGEALPSLAAVGRLTLISRHGAADAMALSVEAGRIGPLRPAALNHGTRVELRDLFFATPARLKFLRSDRAEAQAIGDVVRRLALAAPDMAFRLTDETDGAREVFRADRETGDLFDAMRGRARQVLGNEFVANSVPVEAERDGVRLTGLAGLPTWSRGAASAQFLFVNGRPVRDRLLLGALRAAYFDFLPRDRHAAAVLFVDCPAAEVDVNVHPAKAEVRFRNGDAIRGLIVSAIRQALAGTGLRATTTMTAATLRSFQPGRVSAAALDLSHGLAEPESVFLGLNTLAARVEPDGQSSGPLGAARAQLHENYVIAQTADGMVIVDQHAAHERLVYERLKRQRAERAVASQVLLIPLIVELSPSERMRVVEAADDLASLGLKLEGFGGNAVCIREVPAILGQADLAGIVRDIADELGEAPVSLTLEARMDAVLSRIACHGSVRSGRRMSGPEMDALLREMEATPHSGQCNHGRPTFVELKLTDIERLFGRT